MTINSTKTGTRLIFEGQAGTITVGGRGPQPCLVEFDGGGPWNWVLVLPDRLRRDAEPAEQETAGT